MDTNIPNKIWSSYMNVKVTHESNTGCLHNSMAVALCPAYNFMTRQDHVRCATYSSLTYVSRSQKCIFEEFLMSLHMFKYLYN